MGKNAQGKKPVKRQFSSGGVVFKIEKSKILWLICRSNPSKDFPNDIKRLPKGWIDDAEAGGPGPITSGQRKATPEELMSAALREVREEGGVEAQIVQKIGTEQWFLTLERDRIHKFVTYFLMEWQKNLPEGFGEETAEIYWLPFAKAYKLLSYSSEKKILKRANEILKGGLQPSLI